MADMLYSHFNSKSTSDAINNRGLLFSPKAGHFQIDEGRRPSDEHQAGQGFHGGQKTQSTGWNKVALAQDWRTPEID